MGWSPLLSWDALLLPQPGPSSGLTSLCVGLLGVLPDRMPLVLDVSRPQGRLVLGMVAGSQGHLGPHHLHTSTAACTRLIAFPEYVRGACGTPASSQQAWAVLCFRKLVSASLVPQLTPHSGTTWESGDLGGPCEVAGRCHRTLGACQQPYPQMPFPAAAILVTSNRVRTPLATRVLVYSLSRSGNKAWALTPVQLWCLQAGDMQVTLGCRSWVRALAHNICNWSGESTSAAGAGYAAGSWGCL